MAAGLLAFALGACVTLLCLRLLARRRAAGWIELADYLVQLSAAAASFCAALRRYLRCRRQPWFLLACFYGTFALGTLYWTLHLLLRQETP